MARIAKRVEPPRNGGEQRQENAPRHEESALRRDGSDVVRPNHGQGRSDSKGTGQTDRGVADAVHSASVVILGMGASGTGGSVYRGLVGECDIISRHDTSGHDDSPRHGASKHNTSSSWSGAPKRSSSPAHVAGKWASRESNAGRRDVGGNKHGNASHHRDAGKYGGG